MRARAAPWRLEHGDALEVVEGLPAASFDGLLSDPPYGLGAPWDGPIPPPAFWRQVARVLAPGAWVLAFGSPRTHHRLMSHMEEGGLELRDTLAWLYATGMPKGPSTLKPAWEPVVLARRPGPARELAIEACRVRGPVLASDRRTSPRGEKTFWGARGQRRGGERHHPAGRWPANLALGHGAGCGAGGCAPGCAVAELEAQRSRASRFFYCPKPAGREAAGNPHPTKKPVTLTAWLARLIRPAGGGRLLVPFCGSGSEMVGALAAGWEHVLGIEHRARWVGLARRRLGEICGGGLQASSAPGR